MSKQPNTLDVDVMPHDRWVASDEYHRAHAYVARQPDAAELLDALGLNGREINAGWREDNHRKRVRV